MKNLVGIFRTELVIKKSFTRPHIAHTSQLEDQVICCNPTMASEENLLNAMLERATNAYDETVDELAVQMFCIIVRNDSGLIHKATDLIVSKIRAINIAESIKAISLLEECMSKCGVEFQDEVAKFRFLNDLIRLVSKKYQGAETPPAVREKIMDCLLLWTTEFPQKNKIREAYDMLRKEGVEHEVSGSTLPKRESIMGIDGDKLRKLLYSNDAENLKRANLLIQHQFNQDARRTELKLRRKTELQEVQNTVAVLNQMLDVWTADSNDSDSMNLIRDLYVSCKKYKPILERFPEMIDNTEEDLIAETFEANDILQAAMKRYVSIIADSKAANTTTNQRILTNTLSSTPLQPVNISETTTSINLLTSLVEEPPIEATPIVKTTNDTSAMCDKKTILDDLSDIFGNVSTSKNSSSNIYTNLELLEPIPIAANDEHLESQNETNQFKKATYRELRDIDEISEELFKKNLPSAERIGSFKKDPEKITLNDLLKEKSLTPKMAALKVSNPVANSSDELECYTKSQNEVAKEKSNAETTVTESNENPPQDDLILSSDDNEKPQPTGNPEAAKEQPVKQLPSKHLSDIEIDLDDVTPTLEERLLLNDDDIKITLNFTEDKPSHHVSVIVITVENRSKLPVTDFHFEASVHKPSKVRLLPPTDTAMPAQRPFRQPTSINQIMLLLNPTQRPVDVTCIVGYRLGDDPDPIKESIVANNIPYVG